MTKALGLLGGFAVAALGSAGAMPALSGKAVATTRVTQIRRLSFEFVGQFVNSPAGVTPATHVHYGYLSYIRGVPAFKATPQSEATAVFSFYADGTTLRIIPDGPLRLVSRVGRLTIYRDLSGDGSFARPETFRNGTPVLVGTFRQHVVNNTVTGAFTTFHQVTINRTRPFSARRGRVQLGRVGQTFRIAFSGHGNMPGPPSGFFGGYGVSG